MSMTARFWKYLSIPFFINGNISPLPFQGHYAQVLRSFLKKILRATLCSPLIWLRFETNISIFTVYILRQFLLYQSKWLMAGGGRGCIKAACFVNIKGIMPNFLTCCWSIAVWIRYPEKVLNPVELSTDTKPIQ